MHEVKKTRVWGRKSCEAEKYMFAAEKSCSLFFWLSSGLLLCIQQLLNCSSNHAQPKKQKWSKRHKSTWWQLRGAFFLSKAFMAFARSFNTVFVDGANWLSPGHHFWGFFVVGARCLSAGRTWDSQQGFEPPPEVCQRWQDQRHTNWAIGSPGHHTLRLTCGPAGDRTATGNLPATSRTSPYQLLHRDAFARSLNTAAKKMNSKLSRRWQLRGAAESPIFSVQRLL